MSVVTFRLSTVLAVVVLVLSATFPCARAIASPQGQGETQVTVGDKAPDGKAKQSADGSTKSGKVSNGRTSTDGTRNPPPPAALDQPDKKQDGTFVARDEISFYGGIVQTLAWFISGAAVLFGAIVGINVFQGSSLLADAREELKGVREELHKVKEAKEKYESGVATLSSLADKIFTDTVDKIKIEAMRSIEDVVRREFEVTTVSRYKSVLLTELAKDSPDEKFVFTHLTDIISYPDANSLKIYALCTRKLSSSVDVSRIVANGLQIAAEKQVALSQPA